MKSHARAGRGRTDRHPPRIRCRPARPQTARRDKETCGYPTRRSFVLLLQFSVLLSSTAAWFVMRQSMMWERLASRVSLCVCSGVFNTQQPMVCSTLWYEPRRLIVCRNAVETLTRYLTAQTCETLARARGCPAARAATRPRRAGWARSAWHRAARHARPRRAAAPAGSRP